MTISEFRSLLDGVAGTADKFVARCPGHEDGRASLSVGLGEDGRILVNCHAGCDKDDLLGKLGLTTKDLFLTNGNGHHAPQIIKTYPYRDEAGRELFQVCRMRPKDFRVRRPDGNGGHVWNLNGTRRVLYRLPEVIAGVAARNTIYFPEGEKDADALVAAGVVATTIPGGANAKMLPAYGEALRGASVTIIADKDEPGRKHAQTKADFLDGIAASVRIVEAREGKDAADHLAAGYGVDQFVAVADSAIQPHIDSGISNMERLIDQHHEDVRFLRNVGWHAYDGDRFAPNAEAELVRRAIATVRTMYREAADIEDEKERETFLTHIRKSESEPELRRMLKLAESHIKVHVQEAAAFDADPMLLNCVNGTLDLRTGELRPHRREDMLTKLAGCAYDPNATCDTWIKFLDTTFDGDDAIIRFIRRLVGYFLTGEIREHILPILWGSGANGKTTWFKTLLAVLGDYGTTAPADLLVLRKHQQHPTELMTLMGARLAVASETPMGAYLAESLVKGLTGGDPITARRVFHDYITFQPSHKLVLATNHKPQIRGTDDAVWRRVLLVPFAHTVAPEDQDVHLLDKLAAELPGILAWAVQGCIEWQSEGLRPPEAVQAATSAYRAESDHFPVFTDECMVSAAYAKVEKGSAYCAYTDWCKANGEEPMPNLDFGRRLKAMGAGDAKSNSRRYWTGFGLVAKEQQP